MDLRKLQRAIVDGLEDVKAQNIVVFNTEHLSPLFERVVVASGTSNRQTKALAASVRDAVKGIGLPPPRTEGEVNGEWIIVDCGAAVVHVMQPSIRDYYHLEELWGEKPVKMKLGGPAKPAPAKTPTAGAKTSAHWVDGVPAAKKAGAKTAAVKKAAAKKAPAKKAPAKKVAAKQSATGAASKKASAMQAKPAVVTRTVGVKSTAKTAARKTSATPARKTAARKTPTGRTAVAGAPARKPSPRKTPASR
jgi:ribosome-associated protein